MGLGTLADVSLAEASDAAAAARKLIRQGINPIDQRSAARADGAAQAGLTFAHRWPMPSSRPLRQAGATSCAGINGAAPLRAVGEAEITQLGGADIRPISSLLPRRLPRSNTIVSVGRIWQC